MKKIFYLISFILLALVACKQQQVEKIPEPSTTKSPRLTKEKWHWDDSAKQSTSAGYAQVVKVGNTLFISGVPTADLSEEGIRGVYKALEKSLQAFGAGFENVVKENLYTTDIEAMKSLNEVRKAIYKYDFPAATWVQISRLYEKEAKVEVDLIAVLPD